MRRVTRLHYRMACVRNDAIHKAASAVIAQQPPVIGIESLNVAGMAQNRRLTRSSADAALAGLHRQLEYKAKRAGIEIVQADRWFPSSRKCSVCGVVKDGRQFGGYSLWSSRKTRLAGQQARKQEPNA